MELDPMEPTHVAEAVKHLDLKHAVITSVNRDDLPDGGSMHWAENDHKSPRNESDVQGRSFDS